MKKGGWLVLACYILWGLLPIYWKLLSEINSVYILASRIIWSFVFCSLLLLGMKKGKQIKVVLQNPRQSLLLAGCGIMLTLNWGTYIFAVVTGHILESSLAYFLNPILSILIGRFFYGEKLGKYHWISVAVAFLGIMISILRYGHVPYLAIVIGLSFAIYSAMKKKVTVNSEISMFMETMFVTPMACIVIAVMEGMGLGIAGSLTLPTFLILMLSGVVTSVPLILFSRGIKEISLSLSGILMYCNPTLQMLVGIFLYHEKLTVPNVITFACVWIALILFLYGDKQMEKSTSVI